MPKRTSQKPPKPTVYEAGILRRIAGSCLVKTHIATKNGPVWTIDGAEISHECAARLIRKGFVKEQRDGLTMFDESQTYKALVP